MSADSEKVDGGHRHIVSKHERTVKEMNDRAVEEVNNTATVRGLEETLLNQVSDGKAKKHFSVKTGDEMASCFAVDETDKNSIPVSEGQSVDDFLWKQITGDKGYQQHHLEKLTW